MIFEETELPGAYLVKMAGFNDERGFFSRIFCQKEFSAISFEGNIVQSSISYNKRRGTLRGMHYQVEPAAETKIVCCVSGLLYDVIVDLREDSPTFKQWISIEMCASGGRFLFIPEGFAHGFQTLEDDTTLIYMMSEYYNPHYARGVRWNDPAFGIEWPIKEPVISEKDQSLPDF